MDVPWTRVDWGKMMDFALKMMNGGCRALFRVNADSE